MIRNEMKKMSSGCNFFFAPLSQMEMSFESKARKEYENRCLTKMSKDQNVICQ